LGLFAAPALVLTETVLQEGTKLEHRARVFSVREFLMRLTLLISVSGAAWMVALTDPSTTMLACAAGLVVLGVSIVAAERRGATAEPGAVA
jgi:hypothetical protein